MSQYELLIEQLSRLETEQPNPRSADIDLLKPLEIARLINTEDKTVAVAVAGSLEAIALAAEKFSQTLKTGGRVFYIGAGTSGRLGVLDAAECPPTFGSDPSRIIGVISGGFDTLALSREGVEDRAEAAVEDLKIHNLNSGDFVIGLAASKRTPYTLAGLEFAKDTGSGTAFIVCNKVDAEHKKLLSNFVDIIIPLEVGPEVITGSTRMKSGTAQKMALNIISTTAMVRLGKTYGNLMVDLQAKSEKLAARSHKILIDLFKIDTDEAEQLLIRAAGSVKKAIVMKKHDCGAEEAAEMLNKADGFIRKIRPI